MKINNVKGGNREEGEMEGFDKWLKENRIEIIAQFTKECELEETDVDYYSEMFNDYALEWYKEDQKIVKGGNIPEKEKKFNVDPLKRLKTAYLKEDEGVKLMWVNEIRERIGEKAWNKEVLDFIKPILDWGEEEEERITEELKGKN